MANLRNLKKRIAQYEATTGRKVSQQVIEAWAREEIAAEQQRGLQEKQLQLQQRALESDIAFKQQALAAQEEAAEASGLVQLGSAGLQAGMLLKDTEIGKKVGAGVKGLLTGGAEAAVAPGAIAQVVGEGVPGAVAPALTEVAAPVAAGEGVVSGVTAVEGAAGFGEAAAGLVSPLAIGGMALSAFGEELGLSEELAGGVGGALTGFAVGGPVGPAPTRQADSSAMRDRSGPLLAR